MNRVVVDASFCGAWVLEDEHSPEAEELLVQAVRPGGPILYSPMLWTYEMLNLLRSAVKRKRISDEDARDAINLLGKVPIKLIPPGETENQQRLYAMARFHDLTAYDASYLELADRLQCPLKSGDKKLLSAYSKQITP